MSLPETDMCVVKPEMCHFHKGTCRDEIWGKENCMIGHTVYLANSSNLKVGITRGVSPLKRWIDQGAIEAIPLGVTKNRLDSGTVELALKKHISDKTNWRKMLKGETEDVDLAKKREELVEYVPQDLDFLVSKLPTTRITYPVLQYPVKIRSLNFEKNPLVTGKLNGIKGQYLIFDNEVINIRNMLDIMLNFQHRFFFLYFEKEYLDLCNTMKLSSLISWLYPCNGYIKRDSIGNLLSFKCMTV